MVKRKPSTSVPLTTSTIHQRFKQQKHVQVSQPAPPVTHSVPAGVKGSHESSSLSVQPVVTPTCHASSEFFRLPTPTKFSLARTVCSFGFHQLAPTVWLPHNWQLVSRSDLLQLTAGKGKLVPGMDLDTGTDLMQAVTDDRGLLIRPFNYGVGGAGVQWLVLSQSTELVVRTIAPPSTVQGFSSPAELQFITPPQVTASDIADLKQAVIRCLRLHEEFSEYHSLLHKHRTLTESLLHVGKVQYLDRLWRSPTVWEDLVLTQLCVNCTWSRTQTLSSNLCRYVSKDGVSFPTQQELLQYGEAQLQLVCRVGFRARRLIQVAQECVDNHFEAQLTQLSSSSAPSSTIAETIMRLHGYGPYTANLMLQLLGRYDCCAVDIETLRHLKHVTKQTVTEKTCSQVYGVGYQPFAPFQFLVYWSELQHNYQRQAQST